MIIRKIKTDYVEKAALIKNTLKEKGINASIQIEVGSKGQYKNIQIRNLNHKNGNIFLSEKEEKQLKVEIKQLLEEYENDQRS